jgi:hypothetical protein
MGGVEEMNFTDQMDANWCRHMFAMLAENGVWGVPRSGLLFKKQADLTLVLFDKLPHDPAMPLTEDELLELQDVDYTIIREKFEAAGITVRKAEDT